MLGGFIGLWLAFALLVNKAPNYTRLLITLPFVAYLVVEALRWATNRWRSVRFAPQLIVGAFVVAIVALNVSAAWDYVQLGRKNGEAIGSTGRFVAAHDDVPGQKFYVASSDTQPYYVWGNLGTGNDRVSLFTRPTLIPPRSTRPRSRTFEPFRRSPSSCAVRSGTRSRPSCQPSIRAGGSATSRPTARGSWAACSR